MTDRPTMTASACQVRLPVAWLGWAVALLPAALVCVVFLVSTTQGRVDPCNPFWDGCTSISRVARQPETIYLFRAVMLPYTALLMLFWVLAAAWCRVLNPQRRRSRVSMLAVGVAGAGFLVVYATYLGESTDLARWMRRYGINGFFALTVLAQMLLASQVLADARLPRWLRNTWLGVCALLLGLGLASLPLQYVVDDRDAMLNAVEWQYALLMIVAYPLTAIAWRRTGFDVGVRINAPGATTGRSRPPP
jgi:hypothetical protein